MLCENCKSREAAFHRVVVVNGKRKETHLCVECLQQSQEANVSEIVASFFAPAMRTGYQCESCGQTLSDFQQNGKLGCVGCYSAFSDALNTIFRRIHGATRHAGRVPGGLRAIAEEKPQSELDSLREALKRAIAEEEFEAAVNLRDRIREMEVKGGDANEQK